MRQMCLRIEITLFLVKCSLFNALCLWIPRESEQISNAGVNWNAVGIVNFREKNSEVRGLPIPRNSDVVPLFPIVIFMATSAGIMIFFIYICCQLVCKKFQKSILSEYSSRADLVGSPNSTTHEDQGITDLNPRNYMRQFAYAESRSSVGDSDAPPEYAAVVGQKSTVSPAAKSNQYPEIVLDKKPETPPPAYVTVVPFK
ncbi:hypothetical protein NPIL_256691 [Nephila pilipes]|uniref:Uncharacterized protein n=1 Tax=Nephila pilipes TaxID=299642 RepID=A0A8X6UG53_NEPPI|nr:hypothetical protein NPIL_256691 [Nephila pilipes]